MYFAVATSLWFSFLTIVLTHDNIQKRWEPVQEIINKISGSILIGLGCLILINILF
jgi:threonine/homoserine/homoserine lactone efflux protein